MLKDYLKRIIAISLCLAMLSVNVYAGVKTQDEILEQSIMNTVSLLKGLYEDKYHEAEENIKELIKDKGYDFNYSMDTFYDQPNPFKNADSIRILAAYMTCKNHSSENLLISSIPFIDYSIEEHKFEEYVPTKIDHYYKLKDSDSDIYYKYGYDYINEPQRISKYEEVEKNRYKKTNDYEEVVPDSKESTFIEVSLHVITPEDIFKRFGLAMADYEKEFNNRIKKLRRVTSNEHINQSVTLRLPTYFRDDSGTDYTVFLKGLSGSRSMILQTALSLRNRVPYEWGGKSSKPGYDTSWWSYNDETGLQHGLDCSGFVQWVYRTTGFDEGVLKQLTSTSSILASDFPEISKDMLLPGDIGCTNKPLGKTNHTGIYLGNNLWIHCSSGKGTVTVSEYNFSKFYSVADDNSSNDKIFYQYADSFYKGIKQEIGIDTDNLIDYTHKYTESDIILLSKVIYNEARGEGINGWIAVAETVMNRVASDKFPNTIEGVVYQDGQFSGTDNYDQIVPTEDICTVARMVANGSLKYLNNENVLFFRNPMITNDIPSTEPVDWGNHKYFVAVGNHAFYTDQDSQTNSEGGM